MKVEQRKTHSRTLLSFVLIALMLVIVLPTYVQADRILDGRDALKWLIENKYIENKYVITVTNEYNANANYHYRKRHTSYRTTPRFERFNKLMYSDPASLDGLKGVNWYSATPREIYPKLINNVVITVDWQTYIAYKGYHNPNPPNPPIPPQPSVAGCSSIGSGHYTIGNKQTLGTVCTYFSNGHLRSETRYKNNKKHGLERFFHNTGDESGVGYNENGHKVGRWKYPYRPGTYPNIKAYCRDYDDNGKSIQLIPSC